MACVRGRLPSFSPLTTSPTTRSYTSSRSSPSPALSVATSSRPAQKYVARRYKEEQPAGTLQHLLGLQGKGRAGLRVRDETFRERRWRTRVVFED